MKSIRHLPALAALLVMAAPLLAAKPKPDPQFSEVTTVVAVEVPVQVLADGKPVRGLTAADFEIVDGRQTQQITDFEVVDLAMSKDSPTAAAAPIPAAGRRYFLLLFDLSFSRPASIVKARQAARDLVLEDLHPSDLVAVATYSARRGAALLLGFSSDRQQIDLAIDSLGLPQLVTRSPDPLAVMLGSAAQQSQVSGFGGGSIGRAEKSAAREEAVADFLEQMAVEEQTARRKTEGNDFAALSRSFTDLARLMGNVKGRKQVVYLSEGFDSQVVSGTISDEERAAMNTASESGELWKIDSEARFGSTKLQNDQESMLEEFRRADCAVQAVDIGGLEAQSGSVNRRSQRDSLFVMAKDTGGQLFENFNDLGQAMGKMLEATSVTYVLTYQPQGLEPDGKYRKIKVRLTGGPQGATLVHRPGYYAPKPYSERSGIEQQLDAAQMIVSGEPGGDLEVGVAAAAFRGAGDRMHVPVIVEIEGSGLGLSKKGDVLPVGIYVYAFDEAGGVGDFVAQTIALDFKQVGARLAKEPLKFAGDLRLAPGRYALRTLVRAGEAGSYWLGKTSIEVPAFAPGELTAVTPLLPDPMTTGVVVRSAASAAKTQGLAFPFMMGSDIYLPKGLPAFAKGGELKACLNVYGLDNSEVAVKGELIDADGRTVPDAEVKVVGRTASDQPGLQRLELVVKPGGAGAGDYSLRVTVEQAGRSSSASTSVRVSS